MSKFRFQGYSDDTFGEYEQTKNDYDNCASGKPIQFELKAPDGAGVVVTGMYCHKFQKGDGWMIGVEVLNESIGVDDWEFTLNPSHEGYRNELIVMAPDDAVLTCLNRRSK